MSDLPPPGWYDDPTSPVYERWWDGQQWSEQTRPKTKQPLRTQPGGLSNIGDLLSETFNLIGSRWDDLLLVAVVAGVVQALAAVLLVRPVAAAIDIVNDQIVGWGTAQTIQIIGFGLIAVAITMVAALAHYRICWEAANDEPSSWSAALAYGWVTLPRLVGWAIVGVLPVLVWFTAFVLLANVSSGLASLVGIGGFFAVVWWGVTLSFMPIAMVAHSSRSNPILKSLALVKGRWWKLFGRLILIGLLTGLISGAVGAIVARFTGNDLFGFVITDLGDGDISIVKDLEAPVSFFLSNAVLFIYSVAFTVLQIAAVSWIAFEVWRRPEPEPEYGSEF